MKSAPSPRVRQGDCIELMREFEPDTFTAIVTDPPYGLEFMGKGWDRGLPPVEVWREAQYVEIINRRLADATT